MDLLELHRTGQLAARYPEVQELIRNLSGAELLRAGRLLSRLTVEEVRQEHPNVPVVTAAITGHSTLAPLIPALTAEFARHGLLLQPRTTGFGSYVFELSDPAGSIYATKPDLVLCVLDPAVVSSELPVPWRTTDVERIWAEKLDVIDGLAKRFEAAGHGALVVNTVPLPHDLSAQLVDYASRARLGALWREANARLLRLAAEYRLLWVLDLDPLIAEGIAATEPRFSVYTKTFLSPDLLARYAREIGQLARNVTGRTRKCLVLDLDDTVWGGTVGEVGPHELHVAETTRGAAFSRFQRVLKQLGSQGVLLAAVSKNDPDPVRAAFRETQGMILREEDFVRIVANWRPKHENIIELATDLNLGTDSFVFVDDNLQECAFVHEALPEVTVLPVDGDPAQHPEVLLKDGWFDTFELTPEDSVRGERYREDLQRRDFLQSFPSIEEYLRKLNITIRLDEVSEPEISRVAQLTQRTNQFNLTTRRMQPSDVRGLMAEPQAHVLAVHAADRFGDNGLVGAVFTRWDGDVLWVDNYLLSCRVFSRGIEAACLAALLHQARTDGATAVIGEYRPTAKNDVVKDFYPKYGFRQFTSAGETPILFRHDLAEIMPPPDYVYLTGSAT
jgi:FkbH-like protein